MYLLKIIPPKQYMIANICVYVMSYEQIYQTSKQKAAHPFFFLHENRLQSLGWHKWQEMGQEVMRVLMGIIILKQPKLSWINLKAQ